MIVDDEHSVDHQACIILALILGIIIFAKLGNHCYLYYIVSLIDLNIIKDLN